MINQIFCHPRWNRDPVSTGKDTKTLNYTKERNPDVREGNPDVREGNPDVGERNPDVRESSTDVSERNPDVGESSTEVREGGSICQKRGAEIIG
ncbi:MAG: hypothetical protein HY769_06755 [Candidatus Stahlbacteria bacterium]|nr:hypothetical protein [Candidatus Stahlbacteria bacterium]